jgi:hypothetical protein
MTFQGVQSIGAGAARIYNVKVYLCPKCGCNGRYDEKALKIIENQMKLPPLRLCDGCASHTRKFIAWNSSVDNIY